ncbi:unnamed protein product [Paramecium pentaurelia]|uniref:JmjC domain-containing protein n=1 Tax=Paramecium pentaurelia TaxID=43138 RepID=A0A8S1U7Z5_9CILI|nr:unnamed protein product [Paramecium pentaurelia]
MYLSFIKEHFTPSQEELDILEAKETQDLYSDVQIQGGFIQVYSRQCSIFDSELYKKQLKVFQKYLLNYEKQNSKLNGLCLEKAFYVEQTYSLDCQVESPETWLREQVTVWQLPTDIVNKLNSKCFTFEDIAKRHGNQMVDIRIQDPNTDTFTPTIEQNCIANQMRIDEYCKYLKNKTEFFQKHTEYSSDKVLFAVNVDMDNWDEETGQLYEYMPQSLLKYDGLVYMRQFCLGVNIPQIYIKTKGVWTGGHQENSSVNSLNFNHGPGDCLWLTVDAQHVKKLYEIMPNLYQIEGLWFKEIDFFLENNIPIKYTIQKKGDLVILGAGCLHWVKSLGNTINTSWNLLVYSEDTFQQIYDRQLINDQYQISSVLPIKNLFLDIYIHRKSPVLKTFLHKFIQEDIDNYLKQSTKIKNCKKKFNSREVLQCNNCKMEIFIFYQIKNDQTFRCIKCLDGEEVEIFMKYKPTELILVLNAEKFSCSPTLCTRYMGNTECQLDKQTEEFQSESYQSSIDLSKSAEEQSKTKFTRRKEKSKTSKKSSQTQQQDRNSSAQTNHQNRQKRPYRKKTKGQDDLISEICTSQKSHKKNENNNTKSKLNKKIQKVQKLESSVKSVSSSGFDSHSQIQLIKKGKKQNEL